MRVLFCFLFLHVIYSQLQINFYLTHWVNNDDDLQHDCLHVSAPSENYWDTSQIVSYCMGEWSSKWNIEQNNYDPKFTFAELSKQNITSEQLYFWSAPMDIIENYQFYLNQLANSKNKSMETELFYNCTLPNFGSKCEYVLNDHKPFHLSLYEIIHDFYNSNGYDPTILTCYTHLECNRGLPPSCLDWSEICDGKVDCLDGGQDEKHCWQLEIHECNYDEYRCPNGQCTPFHYLIDGHYRHDCLHQSEESYWRYFYRNPSAGSYIMQEPNFVSEDAACTRLYDERSISLTSSCVPQRQHLLLQAMFSVKPESISNECWTAFKCIIHMPITIDSFCEVLCFDGTCDEIIKMTCPDIINATTVPILLGHVFLTYEKNTLNYRFDQVTKPTYVCYNKNLLYLPDDNETCRLYNNSILLQDINKSGYIDTYIVLLNTWLNMWTSWIYNDSIVYNKSTMYQCINSYKCISNNRLFDTVQDCFYNDDQNRSMLDKNCSIERNVKYFKCQTTNECVPLHFVEDGICDCTKYDGWICDDEHRELYDTRTKIKFLNICDNLTHLSPIMTDDGQNHTDETECDQWPCNNIYTRCDGYWNCLDGVDELNCDSSPLLNCPSDNHICVSSKTKNLTCLPIEKANDGNVDCIGAVDEPTLCRTDEFRYTTFYCKRNDSTRCLNVVSLCDAIADCINNEDEQSCMSDDFKIHQKYTDICVQNYEIYGSGFVNTICKVLSPHSKRYGIKYVELAPVQNPPNIYQTHRSNYIFTRSPLASQTIQHYQQRCHRGLDVQVWLNKEKRLTTNTCLCPPSYYGDMCQFQNQRVSVSIKFRATSDSIETPFIIIISLIDDSEERTIHSYEQFTYIAKYHCIRRFNTYLLYSIRPKNQTKQYAIHIDIFENISLNYRGSVIKPLLFTFLPVHRLSFNLDIPRIDENIHSCSNHQCINGKCRRYSNDSNNMTFCQCNYGWSGRYCTIKHNCTCSSDSLCIGKLANDRSLCVCPLGKIGQRCLLNNPVCQIEQHECRNGGQCIPVTLYEKSDTQFICICTKGYYGDRCEFNQTKMIVSFDNDIVLPPAIRIHLIRVGGSPHFQELAFKMIPFGQTSFTIYRLPFFNIVLIELTTNNYYLTSVRKNNDDTTAIETTLHPSNRCLHINELFNETMANYHPVRRIKYYHVLCQTNTSPHLSCFYDDIQFCLCQDHDHQRVANCFEFNYDMQIECSVASGCENGGTCLEDNYGCPQTTFCACPVCFYGTRCQLSTSGFSLSLDAILGYHIRPHIDIVRQPPTVLISLILSVVITVAGVINGVLTLITFKHKSARTVGCGIYLLYSSINTLLIMIIFTLKIWILVLSHIGSIQKRSFLSIQCTLIDFLLQACLTIDQWLTTCVAIERAYITIKGINFNRKKIKLTAKLVIIGLILIAIGTSIHDPIYRRLFDEEIDEEKRIWCIIEYSSALDIVNLVLTIFHITVPFIINFISAFIIIIINARQRAGVQEQQKYKKILNEQIQQHKHLLIGPCVFIILAIPRSIISFASGCMKSASDSWLFLLGYFMSLIPPLLTFILFVLPSTTYYEVFRMTISRYRNVIRMRQ